MSGSPALFDPAAVEAAFRTYWQTGIIREDWNAWADLFTEDVAYHERMLGSRYGREQVREWILPLMEKYRDLYGVYEWHMVDASGRVVFTMQNRRDLPDGTYVDFPGISILQYAGAGRWSMEEDYWAPKLAEQAYLAYERACAAHPDHRARQTRRDWGQGPAWTRGAPSYAERAGARR
jgi:hypothetical protein